MNSRSPFRAVAGIMTNMITWRASLLLALVTVLPARIATADEIIATHGEYSDSYLSDWSTLPTGKVLGHVDLGQVSFNSVEGDDVREVIANQASVEIRDLAYRVSWQNDYDKYQNALIHIREAEDVVIENLAILQEDSDYRSSAAILIEDSGNVVIRNVYVGGTTHSFHIRVEGCENVLIENVEISGIDYGSLGVRTGGGIRVDNGSKGEPPNTPNPRSLEWLVIQHVYGHDYLDVPSNSGFNHDGILVMSGADGILFNSYFENWRAGNSAIDVSHRVTSPDYQDHVFRVERNIVRNSFTVKAPGNSTPSNTVVFANNVYVNTYLVSYNQGWDIHRLHETSIIDPEVIPLFKLWTNTKDAVNHFRNGLVVVPEVTPSTMYSNSSNNPDPPSLLDPDYMVYVTRTPNQWFRDYFSDFDSWQAAGFDEHSLVAPPVECFTDPEHDDFSLLPDCPAVGRGTDEYVAAAHPGMRVDKDFMGVPRGTNPSCGAFEIPAPPPADGGVGGGGVGGGGVGGGGVGGGGVGGGGAGGGASGLGGAGNGSSDAAADAGYGASAGTGNLADSQGEPRSLDDSGCGCSMPGRPSGAAWLLTLLMALALPRRRANR